MGSQRQLWQNGRRSRNRGNSYILLCLTRWLTKGLRLVGLHLFPVHHFVTMRRGRKCRRDVVMFVPSFLHLLVQVFWYRDGDCMAESFADELKLKVKPILLELSRNLHTRRVQLSWTCGKLYIQRRTPIWAPEMFQDMQPLPGSITLLLRFNISWEICKKNKGIIPFYSFVFLARNTRERLRPSEENEKWAV